VSQTIILRRIGTSYRLFEKSSGRSLLTRHNRFLASQEVRGLSIHSVRSYGYDLLYLWRWIRGKKKIWKHFNQRNLLEYIAFQQTNHAKPKSINRRLTTCEQFYRFCYNAEPKDCAGVNQSTPFYKGRGRDRNLGLFHISRPKKIKLRIKVPRTLTEILDPREVGVFLATITRYRDLSIVYFMLYCGLRFSEVLSLKTKDIGLNELILKVHGKGNKERLLPMPNMLAELLKKYLLLERPDGRPAEPLFVILQGKGRGRQMTNAGLRSLFRYRRKITGLGKANPHRFRHTFATRMAAENVGLPILQRLLGHADVSTTQQYINLSTNDLTKEFQRAMAEIEKDYAREISSPTSI